MAVVLKADTQVVVQFGPFVDKDTGVDLESAISAATLDNVTTGIRISKNGGTFAARAATVVASAYDAHGMYKITLKTGDVDTEGVLRMVYDDAATCLPVWQDYQVVPAGVYDAMFSGTGTWITNLVSSAGKIISGTTSGTPTTTTCTTNLNYPLNELTNGVVIFDDGQRAKITSNTAGPNSVLTFGEIATAVASVTDFVIV